MSNSLSGPGSQKPYPFVVRAVFYICLAALGAGVIYLVVRLPSRSAGEAARSERLCESAELALASPYVPKLAGLASDSLLYEQVSHTEEIKGTIRRRDTVSDLLLRHGFSHELVHAVNQAARPVFDLRKIRAGQRYALASAGTTFCHFTYEIDPEHYLLVESRGGEFHSEIREYPFQIRADSLVGIIASSLFKTVLDLGEGPDLALELTEVFAWDIDFFLDIRKGDSFKIFFERKCLGDTTVCYGRVLAADFSVQGKSHKAVYFCDETGYDDYYTFEGGSLRKALLKAPLRYTRISSNFSYRRFHPVRHRYAPHLGIDYAAPTGTPVRATGDGTIAFAGRKGDNGNMIQIRHNETYKTYYLHLSRFAKGISKGKHVKQGDVIAYVGSTGCSTGPHLDYRIKKHGKFINPRKVDLPAADPVADAYRPQFETLRDHWAGRLARLGSEPTEEIALGGPSNPFSSCSPDR
ncbi:MAG: peptidoglycan DD-metalloendopeptidase family protein [Candidatus Eisenbacteria sp.]|nr:peptidoglycan DD-metalloendopeptidase family protein [Candidatus Eisenbacteria bacterium]